MRRPVHRPLSRLVSARLVSARLASVRLASVLPLVAGLVACGDGGGTGPEGGPVGFYQLRTIGDRTLPILYPPSQGVPGGALREGQLALRGDGTYGLGIAAPLGGLVDGRWRRSGATVTLDVSGGTPFTGRWSGDTLVLLVPGQPSVVDPTVPVAEYRFVRAAPPVPPVPDGTYALRTVDGQPRTADGFVVVDAMGAFGRSVTVIRWDTLVVRAPFVTRTEGVAFANGLPLTAPSVLSGGQELSGWGGTIGGDATRLVVRPFGGERWASGSTADTLAVATGGATPALVRTYAYPGQPARTLRYERVR